MDKLNGTYRIIDAVRAKSDSCLLFCSLGKDSIVTLDLLYPKFERIVCVFMYFVKDLEHINNWIRWAEVKYPKIEFVQVPHWNLSYILKFGMYCTPNPKVKLLKLADVVKSMRLKYGIHYVFLGMKKSDSMNRLLMLKSYEGQGYENEGLVYPLALWNQKDVLSYMKFRGLPYPVRYGLKASNGVGFNADCLLWLREHYPNDLEKIYKVFPLSRKVLFEYDYKNK